MNGSTMRNTSRKAEILRSVLSTEGVDAAEFSPARIGPGQIWDVFAQYDVPASSMIENDIGDVEISKWFMGLLDHVEVNRECYVSLGVRDEPWIRISIADRRALLALWCGLTSRDLLIVDGPQRSVLGLQEEEYEYLAHWEAVDVLLRGNGP